MTSIRSWVTTIIIIVIITNIINTATNVITIIIITYLIHRLMQRRPARLILQLPVAMAVDQQLRHHLRMPATIIIYQQTSADIDTNDNDYPAIEKTSKSDRAKLQVYK